MEEKSCRGEKQTERGREWWSKKSEENDDDRSEIGYHNYAELNLTHP